MNVHKRVHVHMHTPLTTGGGSPLATRRTCLPAQSWLPISACCGSIAGGLIKLGHGSNLTALVVAIAPCAVCALLYCFFGLAFLAATLRFLCTGKSQEEFIATTANAVVAILTRVPMTARRNADAEGQEPSRALSADVPALPKQPNDRRDGSRGGGQRRPTSRVR